MTEWTSDWVGQFGTIGLDWPERLQRKARELVDSTQAREFSIAEQKFRDLELEPNAPASLKQWAARGGNLARAHRIAQAVDKQLDQGSLTSPDDITRAQQRLEEAHDLAPESKYVRAVLARIPRVPPPSPEPTSRAGAEDDVTSLLADEWLEAHVAAAEIDGDLASDEQVMRLFQAADTCRMARGRLEGCELAALPCGEAWRQARGAMDDSRSVHLAAKRDCLERRAALWREIAALGAVLGGEGPRLLQEVMAEPTDSPASIRDFVLRLTRVEQELIRLRGRT